MANPNAGKSAARKPIPSAPSIGAPSPSQQGVEGPPAPGPPPSQPAADSGGGMSQDEIQALLSNLGPMVSSVLGTQLGMGQSTLGALDQLTGPQGPLAQRESQLGSQAGQLFDQYSQQAGAPIPSAAPSLGPGGGLGALAAGGMAELYGRGRLSGPTAGEALGASKEANRQVILTQRLNQLQNLHDQAMMVAEQARQAGNLRTAIQSQGYLTTLDKNMTAVKDLLQQGLEGASAQRVASIYAGAGVTKAGITGLSNFMSAAAREGLQLSPEAGARLFQAAGGQAPAAGGAPAPTAVSQIPKLPTLDEFNTKTLPTALEAYKAQPNLPVLQSVLMQPLANENLAQWQMRIKAYARPGNPLLQQALGIKRTAFNLQDQATQEMLNEYARSVPQFQKDFEAATTVKK